MYGCFLLLVWAGVIHWSAVQSLVVETSISTEICELEATCSSVRAIVNGEPYGSVRLAASSQSTFFPAMVTAETSR
jgi:hypothetical protein